MSTQEIFQVFLLRYRDLLERKVVNNRMTLKRWMELKDDPFPPAIALGPNSVAWDARAVEAWIQRRSAAGRGSAA